MRLNGTRTRRANALIEMAFVMIPLTYIAFGTVEFGYFFYIKHTVQGAAREGCRAAITPSATTSDVQTAVAGSLFAAGLIPANSYSSMTSKSYTLSVSPSVSSSAGTAITVTVSNTWGNVGIRASGLIGTAKSVSGSSVMRKEG
jgi:Flp pilus assembly protein TadG